ncbi:MAG: sugar phosphate isomerase/epimerase family protein [Omnitrophica WOR_2 bacterium]
MADLWKASLSTMWGIKKFPTIAGFLLASRKYGFDQVELNHQVDSCMLLGIELHQYRFSSVHEPCPADISSDRLKAMDWLISACDEYCREQGVQSIRRSIDLARKLGAKVVVVHAGIIPGGHRMEEKLSTLYDSGQAGSQEYLHLKRYMERTRSMLAGPRLESVKKSLVELIEYASLLGIRLGLENRYYYFDIPNLDELGDLLTLAGPDQLGWIYDVGHAQALDLLGFYPHDEWLKRYSSRMIGAHLHDTIGIHDHYAPGLGEIDFSQIAPYLPLDAFRTCEIRPRNTPEEVEAGMKYLADRGCVICR